MFRGVCRCGARFYEALGLCHHILFNPSGRRETVGGSVDDFAEMLGGEVQQISIVLDLARLPIVLDDKVAEAVEDVGIAVLCPLPVLVATVVIEELIAHGKLCQQDLIAVGQLPVSMVGNDVELVDNGEQMCSLLVGQRTDGGVVELLVVVAEGVETEVVEHLRRYEQQGIAKVVGAIDRVHNMTRKNDGQVVFVMGDDPHVIHGPCAAAQDEGQDDVWEYEIFVVAEESWHLTHHQDVGFLMSARTMPGKGSSTWTKACCSWMMWKWARNNTRTSTPV